MAKNSEDPNLERPPKVKKTDEIQREFWQYRRVWITIFVILIAAKLILPHIPQLRGWEQKFSNSTIEIGKADIPPEAIRTSTIESINMNFKPPLQVPPGFGEFTGPHLIAAWKCEILKAEALCLRYMWNHEPMTLVLTTHGPKIEKYGPFVRSGWAGFFIVKPGFAAAATGPFSPEDIRTAWQPASVLPVTN